MSGNAGNGANNELATDTVHLRCGGGGTMTTIYRLGYCARDITAADCGLCVVHTVAELPNYCQTA